MSLHNESSNNYNNNGGQLLSDLLRDNKELSSRSRFISDDTMFGNINDIPDKSFDLDINEEESKDNQKISNKQPASIRILPPVELLGIPLLEMESHAEIDDNSDESRRRIMLSPFAQKDSVVLGTSTMWKSSNLFDLGGRKFPSEFEPDKTGNLKHGEDA